MSLKDWKKTKQTNNIISWNNGKVELFISRTGNYGISSNKVTTSWSILLRKMSALASDYIKLKDFKTKSQALKYAKLYMRKH